MDGLPSLQSLGPHRDVPLAVGHTPALLAQTLRLEAGERPVVRDGHSLSRHGLLPGMGREGGGERGGGRVREGVQETPAGPGVDTVSRG